MPILYNFANKKGVFMIPSGGTKSPTPAPPSFNNTKSLLMDGVDEYISLGDSDDLSFGNGTTDSPFSVSAWVKMDDATKFRILLKADNSATENEWGLFTSASDLLFFQLYDSSTSVKISRYYNTALTSYEGQWIHISATYDGSSSVSGIKLYLNGVRVDDTNSITGSYVAMHNTTTAVEVGKYTTSYASGNVDEVAIFNTELTSDNITSIYNSGTPTDLTSLNPIAWYRNGDNSTYKLPQILMPENTNKDKVSNYSMTFDGVDDYIGSSFTMPADSTYTISIWIKKNGAPSGNQGLIGDMNSSGHVLSGRATIGVRSTGYIYVSMGDGSAYWYDDTSYDLSAYLDNAWHHIALTIDGTALKLYVDGVLKYTYTSTVSAGTIGARPYRIGNYYDSASNGWGGSIDEIAIFDYTLTAGNVTTTYNLGTPTTITGAVAYWKLGEEATFTDNWLVPNSALSNYSNYSFNFDGIDDYIDCSDSDDFSFGNGTTDSPFSVSFWLNVNAFTTNFGIIAKDYDGSNREWTIGQFSASNKIRFLLKNNGGGNQQSIDSTTTLSTGQWYHIACTYDGSGGSNAADGLTIYINGTAETPTNIVKQTYTAMANTTAPLTIGEYQTGGTPLGVNGKIDEVSIYSSELNSTQVSDIFNGGEPTTITGGAVAHWRMGENATYNSGTSEWTIPDQVGSNDGTSSNTMALNTLVGEAPNYIGGGLSDGMTIEDRTGNAPNSDNNAVSYNMEAIDIDNDTP